MIDSKMLVLQSAGKENAELIDTSRRRRLITEWMRLKWWKQPVIVQTESQRKKNWASMEFNLTLKSCTIRLLKEYKHRQNLSEHKQR